MAKNLGSARLIARNKQIVAVATGGDEVTAHLAASQALRSEATMTGLLRMGGTEY